DARGGVADVEADIAADVEDEDLDLADLGLDLGEELDHLLLVARIGAERMDLAARTGDLGHQMLQLVGVPARHHRGVALARKTTGDRSTRRIACADHDADLVSRHSRPPSSGLWLWPASRSTEIKSWRPEASDHRTRTTRPLQFAVRRRTGSP